MIPYAILALRGPSHSSVSSPPTHTILFLWGCSGTGPRVPDAGPLATDGLGLEELGVCGGQSSFAHTPPARVRTCAATGSYRSFPSHGRTPLWPAADRRACPRCARPKEGRVGRRRRKGEGGRGIGSLLPRSLVEGGFTRSGLALSVDPDRTTVRFGVPPVPLSLALARSRLGSQYRSLCCSVPCRSCVRALGNSCTGLSLRFELGSFLTVRWAGIRGAVRSGIGLLCGITLR